MTILLSQGVKKTTNLHFIRATLVTFILLSYPALADDKVKSQDPQTKAEAAKQAQQKVNGRVLKVEQNKNTYRVKVLQKSGRVVSVDIDKKSTKTNKDKKD